MQTNKSAVKTDIHTQMTNTWSTAFLREMVTL